MKISKMPITIRAAGALIALKFVTFAGVQAVANSIVLGVASADAVIGDDVTIDTIGVFDLPAGGAIAVGALVASDALGRPVSTVDATVAFGRALTAVANIGETVKILAR